MQHELVRGAQQGDREAFGAIVHAVIARLYATATLILRDSELAEDAVQEALIAAWRDLRGLRDADRLDAWLHRLLVRACYRVAAQNRRRHQAEIRLAPDHELPIIDLHDRVFDRDLVERALASLVVEHRAVLVLTYYADLSIADVAVALSVPIGTAKSRLHRATDAMRAALDADARTGFRATGETA